jgi:hypothetical protein
MNGGRMGVSPVGGSGYPQMPISSDKTNENYQQYEQSLSNWHIELMEISAFYTAEWPGNQTAINDAIAAWKHANPPPTTASDSQFKEFNQTWQSSLQQEEDALAQEYGRGSAEYKTQLFMWKLANPEPIPPGGGADEDFIAEATSRHTA